MDDLWIFGYGSLIWRPAFAYCERHAGFVRGWARRFWQGSTDHRGIPEAPGRVVTLVPRPGERCWGTVYRVEPRAAPQVLATLDHREQGGYARHRVDVDIGSSVVRGALVYVATSDNPHFAGPASLEHIAIQIRRCHGPSGPNLEYALRLAEALRAMNAEDEHVFAIEALLRARTDSRT